MGSTTSTQMEQSSSSTPAEMVTPKDRMTAEEMQLQQIELMPTYKRPETFDEKLWRKFSKEPLIPIGCLTTAYFLGSGIQSFYNRDAIRSQKMMRLRVGAQLGTLLIFIGYAGINAFNLEIAPGYHSKVEKEENKNRELN